MKTELYRLGAKQCRDLAVRAPNAFERGKWLALAAQWDGLAGAGESRSVQILDFIEPPPLLPDESVGTARIGGVGRCLRKPCRATLAFAQGRI